MKKEFIILCVAGALLLTACGKQEDAKQIEATEEINTEDNVTDTEQQELSELEQKIEDFKKNTSSEITVTQDVLRGEWRIADKETLEDRSYYPEDVKLGNLEVSYDTSSKNSKVIFTNDEFFISYDDAEVSYNDKDGNRKGNKMGNAILVSGLYRVISEPEFEKYEYGAEIEMLITAVSPKYGTNYADIYDELNALVGTTVTEKIEFGEVFADWSDLTEEQLADYDVELHDQVTVTSNSTFGLTGMIYYDTPQVSQANPFTCAHMGTENNGQLFAGIVRTKTKNTVTLDYEDVEPGVFLYDILPNDDVTTEQE